MANRHDIQNITYTLPKGDDKSKDKKPSALEVGFQVTMGGLAAITVYVLVVWIVWEFLCGFCRYGRCW